MRFERIALTVLSLPVGTAPRVAAGAYSVPQGTASSGFAPERAGGMPLDPNSANTKAAIS
jgi:hypothetical protein